MLNQWSNAEVTQVLTKLVAVIALVCGEDSQLARRHAGELRTDFSITSMVGRRAVQVENYLRVCIDKFRRFKRLYTVIRPLAVVAACA